LLNFVLLGAPGVGKGVQGDLLSEKLSVPKISTGDILRDEVKNNTDFGKEAQKYFEKGELVPDNLMEKIIENRLQNDDCKRGFILDGYPRTVNQAEFLLNILNKLEMELNAVFNIKVNEKVIVKRLSNRRVCENCGKVYNLITNPPPENGRCSRCGGTIYQRADDKEDVILERLKVYESSTKPLISFFKNINKLYEVDGEGSIMEVHKKIINLVHIIKMKQK